MMKMRKNMHYEQYGQSENPVILLLHGGGFSVWNYRKAAELLSNEYRVILPYLDGHAGSEDAFISIETCAKHVIDLIDEQFNGQVFLLGGLSLGAQMVCDMLAQRNDIARYALLESASVIADQLTGSLIGPAFSASYGLVKSRRFAKMQFDYYRLDQEYFEEYYRDTCAVSKQNLTAFTKASALYEAKEEIRNTQAKTMIIAGSKETKIILRSAQKLHEMIADSELIIKEGMYHGQLSMNHPQEYVNMIKDLLQK